MPETSIVIKADDKYSDAIKKMSDVTKRFNKDQDAMQEKLNQLKENQHGLQGELKNTAAKLKELEKQFEETGDAAVKSELEATRAKYDTVQRNLNLVKKGASAVEKQMQKTGHAFTSASGEAKRGVSDIMKAMAASGFGQMAEQLGQQLGTAWAGSALGDDGGTIVSSALSGALSGAAMGSAILPGMGTAIGAGVGALAGALSGGAQVAEKKDDYFKSYYNGIVDEQKQAKTAAIQSGSGIAAGRETDKMSFSTLFGSKETAEGYLDDLVDMANHTPFLYDDLTAMSKTLATYGYGAKDILPALETIGDAGAALGMNTSDMSMVATALGRMKSSDKATLEYLNILNDRGIGAVQMLAEAKGLSVGDTYDAISKGKIKGGEAVEIIMAALGEKFGGMMVEQSNTFAGKSSTLTGLKNETENAYGIGYNETRMGGIQAEIDSLDGSLGNALGKLNEISGSLAGYRENLQEQYTREALGAVLAGQDTTLFDEKRTSELEMMGRQYQGLLKEYENAKEKDPERAAELGLKLENLRNEAEALAKNAYDSSEWAKKELSAEEENTEAIRAMTKSFDGWSAKYALEQEKTKGQMATLAWEDGKGIPTQGSTYLTGGGGINGVHAAGLHRVPFDNYLALLHEGERVLTAQEARQADRGSAGGEVVVNISGNQFTVRSDSDVEEIAQALAEQIALARQAGTL